MKSVPLVSSSVMVLHTVICCSCLLLLFVNFDILSTRFLEKFGTVWRRRRSFSNFQCKMNERKKNFWYFWLQKYGRKMHGRSWNKFRMTRTLDSCLRRNDRNNHTNSHTLYLPSPSTIRVLRVSDSHCSDHTVIRETRYSISQITLRIFHCCVFLHESSRDRTGKR